MPKRKSNLIPVDPPEVLELFERILRLKEGARGFDGVIVRSVGVKYSSEDDFFSGEGAAKTGGRWNRQGLKAIYASLDVITATYEAYQNFVTFGFPLTAIAPRVTAGAEVSLSKVAYLTDRSVLRQIGFSKKELIDEDWRGIQAGGEESWTQAIGRGCLQAGFEGLIVPSAVSRTGRNIVIFPSNLHNSSKLCILHPDKLPKPSKPRQ